MTTSTPRISRATTLWTLAGLVLLALNLRAAISGVSPLLDDLQDRFGLSGTAMGVLATLPVLSLGAFASVAPPLARRFGTRSTLAGAMLLIMAGVLLRLVPAPSMFPALNLFLGTAIAGAGIAIGNVLMPSVVKSAYPERIGALTGLAMMLMAAGAAVSAGLAVPLEHNTGWRLSLGVWAAPALIGAAVWLLLALRQRRSAARPTPRSAATGSTPSTSGSSARSSAADEVGSLWKNPLAWSVTAFMGLQSMVFYVLLSWLPAVMRDFGFAPATAGMMLSVLMLLRIPSGLVMPMLAARRNDQRPYVLGVLTLMALGLAGLLLAPQAGWVWIVVLGLGTGAAFPLAFTLISLRSQTPHVAARLSGMAQTVGYLFAGLGPLLFGVLNSTTGDWNVPLIVLSLVLIPEAFVAFRAARPGFLQPSAREIPQPRQMHIEPKDLPTPSRTLSR